jgi:Flp pilus assembly protein TadG
MVTRERHSGRLQRGQATLEFGLTIVFVMLFIVGAIELVMLVYTYSVLADAAKDGVRYAIVHGAGTGAANCSGPGGGGVSCTDSAANNVTSEVTTYAALSLHDTSKMNVTPSYPDSSSVAPCRVRIDVSYVYQPFFGLGWPSVTVYAAAEGRIVF